MALNFPNPPGPNGTTWEDDCGNTWVYDAADNKWSIRAPEFNFPDVDPDAIWARAADGTISPINPGDMLDMGAQNADIDLTNFPEKN